MTDLIKKLESILQLLSIGENCKCCQCQAGRELRKLIEEMKAVNKSV